MKLMSKRTGTIVLNTSVTKISPISIFSSSSLSRARISPARVVSAERLKKYIFQKISNECPEGPFCLVYMHSAVQKDENSPGITILRWIYDDLPSDIKRQTSSCLLHPPWSSFKTCHCHSRSPSS